MSFLKKIYLFIYLLCVQCCACISEEAPDAIVDGSEPPCGAGFTLGSWAVQSWVLDPLAVSGMDSVLWP